MADDTKSNTRRYVRAVGPFAGFHQGLQRAPVRIYNLNVGGCFVSLSGEQPAAIATTIVLTIELPNDGAVKALAQRVYRDPSGIGVRFIDLDDEDSKRVARAVERMRAEQATSTPVVKLPRACVVYTFERHSEVMQIETRYKHAEQTFQIVRRLADGTALYESFSNETTCQSRLDEVRSELERNGWQTGGPTLLTDG